MHNTYISKISRYFFVIIGFAFSLSACHKTIVKDSSKEIISISLKQSDGIYIDSTKIKISIQGNNIIVNLPFYINRTQLIPEISITGVSISPASGIVQNFTSPVTYTVTAADGTTRNGNLQLEEM